MRAGARFDLGRVGDDVTNARLARNRAICAAATMGVPKAYLATAVGMSRKHAYRILHQAGWFPRAGSGPGSLSPPATNGPAEGRSLEELRQHAAQIVRLREIRNHAVIVAVADGMKVADAAQAVGLSRMQVHRIIQSAAYGGRGVG